MLETEKGTINNKHKDRLFNYIFGREENRKWTLQLYNAVNGSHYEDASAIEFNTLEDVLYIGMRNDTSFLVSDVMSVYEHQSSYNPNMPLRMMQYVGNLYSKYLARNKLNKYGSSLIKLPTPKLVVFYNGRTDVDDEVILKLTDSFDENSRALSDIEVKVRMLNINYGRNADLLRACKPLEEYSWFINRINEILFDQDPKDIVIATKTAIDEIPMDFEIRSFLISHKAEVTGMLDTEYNEAEIKELFVEEGLQKGIIGCVELLRSLGLDDVVIAEKIIQQYSLTKEEAAKYLN
ncbi:hypothetical protein [Butyrivibrio sp. FCS006]|uniref:hypothetical protein n=1 Tax=Butyrivibrio sp. FCS006 TaxID=1280684 RepID=UPI0004049455|nr:hypothetical protein [Butyrivibrio sp. FCS006]